MVTADSLKALVRRSLADPEAGAREVIALNPVMQLRWVLLMAGVTAGVVVAYLLPLMLGATDQVLPPFTAAGMQLAVNLATAVGITVFGRMFGGQGRFEDAVLLVAWLQWLMILAQLVQLVVAILLPPFAGLVTIAAVTLFFWLITGFVQALHGFESRGMTFLGVLGMLFAMAMLVSMLLIMAGFDPRGMTDA